MLAYDSLLATVVREPQRLSTLKPVEWDLLLPQARRAGMLAHVAFLTEKSDQNISGRAGEYLDGARAVSRRQAQAVHFEVARIQSALAGSGIPVILLKGAAYQIADLPCSAGRTFTDIDLLVPHDQITTVEKSLRLHGWGAGHNSPYDERYYRKWMHEIPPLMHIRRQTVIDLHHAILPLTARIKSDPQPLFENARSLPGFENLYVLAPADMLLHSATHLFTEGDYNHGLRDLADLDSLLRHFSTDPGFWEELGRRAEALNLGRPLYYALHYCHTVLDTPIPSQLAHQNAPAFSKLMDALFGRALAPEHASCADGLTGLARELLYIRGHWLRMPLHLLLPHLFHKAFLAEREAEKREKEKENGAVRPHP
jgi:hypothetical protein